MTFLDQSQSEVKENQSNGKFLSTLNRILLLKIVKGQICLIVGNL